MFSTSHYVQLYMSGHILHEYGGYSEFNNVVRYWKQYSSWI